MINDKVSESAETTEIDSEVNTEAWLELLKKKKKDMLPIPRKTGVWERRCRRLRHCKQVFVCTDRSR